MKDVKVYVHVAAAGRQDGKNLRSAARIRLAASQIVRAAVVKVY